MPKTGALKTSPPTRPGGTGPAAGPERSRQGPAAVTVRGRWPPGAPLRSWVSDGAFIAALMAAAGVGCSGSYRGLSAIDLSGDEVDGAPDVQLMVDANGGYTVAQARRVGAALDQFGVVGVRSARQQ